MFTLRIIEETRGSENDPFEQVIENFEVGYSYSILKKGDTKEFDQLMRREYPESEIESIESLLCTEQGRVFFIWTPTKLQVYSYFIMSEGGKTFERL